MSKSSASAVPDSAQNASPRSESHAPTTTTSQQSSDEIASLQKQRQTQTNLFRQVITKTPDFPKPGILFEDIFPIFTSPPHHEALIRAYELQIQEIVGSGNKPDILVGLDARGFLIGPTVALRLGCGFVPVRKAGKLPGALQTVTYQKEYGEDSFAIQDNSIPPGSKVIVVDDLIATGGSAAAAGELVKKCRGQLLGYIFIIELVGLNGRSKLDAPVYTLIESQS